MYFPTAVIRLSEHKLSPAHMCHLCTYMRHTVVQAACSVPSPLASYACCRQHVKRHGLARHEAGAWAAADIQTSCHLCASANVVARAPSSGTKSEIGEWKWKPEGNGPRKGGIECEQKKKYTLSIPRV